MKRVIASAALLALLGAGLSGCAGVASTVPDGVSVSIQQNRDDYGPRRIEITVTNDTDASFDIFEARLDSRAFVAAAVTDHPIEVPAGTSKALRLQLDAPACGDGSGETTTVRLAYTTASGSGVATMTPTDPFGSIERIHRQDCFASLVAQTATVTPAAALRVVQQDGVATAQLDVTLTPTGSGEPVTIDAIGRTILLRPASGEELWPVGLPIDATTAPTTITLDIIPNNCNTHTVSEDKRGTFFPVTVSTAADGTEVFYLPVSRTVRGQLYDYISHDFCGWD
ncbi:hypothetical protein HQQ81_19610 [Microbacteriaceae bacterium VKM Ac-2854]|nr:hypothetical protein [Microbacteriaceae bacterium VKM Ac-2854]